MLLLLALVALVSANLPAGCPASQTWLDISVTPAVYRCLTGKRTPMPLAREPAKRQSAATCPFSSVNGLQQEIDILTGPCVGSTCDGWLGLQVTSPIGRSSSASPWVAQTFLSTHRQNLLTLQFAFISTQAAGLKIQTAIYMWDDATSAPTGPAIWTSGTPGVAQFPTSNVQINYNVQGTQIQLTQAEANVFSTTVPINAALVANQRYAVVFFAPADSATGSIGSRQEVTDYYADGQLWWNFGSGSAVPAAGWTSAVSPTNDAAFKLTFSEICECTGNWIDNPFWNQTVNTGVPQNCLESTCASWSATPAAQAGFLDEAYTVQQAANLNGYLCNASYGSVTLPLTNAVRTVPDYEFYRLFDTCMQTVPCVNCGNNVTSDCYRTSANEVNTTCVAQRNVTWPNRPFVSFTSNTTVSPFTGTSGLARAEPQISVAATQCPLPSFPDCPCFDCVTAWQNTTECFAILCGQTNGLENQTAVIVTAGNQIGSPAVPQLFRSCDVQRPAVPAAPALNTRQVVCDPATLASQFACPQLPTE